ncbi:MAG: response regulator transcription factor [Dysosmobacter sp.]
MATILLAEDNEGVRLLTQARAPPSIYSGDGGERPGGLDILNRQHVDLIVADVMMPVMDGYQLVRTLRAEGNEIPWCRSSPLCNPWTASGRAFPSGIDDYLTKPADYEELIWRIQALLRRAHIASEQQILVGNTRLDSASYTVTCRGQTLELPKKEFDLLYKLLSYPGQIFTRSQLLDDVWGYVSESGEDTVKTHISRLRNWLKDVDDFTPSPSRDWDIRRSL